ncbi:hypothetical protein JYU34_000693 [Plutella xylostella]|uniref:Uncharacterized protein n=2 Tax=Plutella xylostella TaxID=51655 RepID=A0ABQ7R8B5_PLUXY|nr:hypothetical protein JYU34_000693 [Plutella xylostella]CAG9138169.1 unnamed protein product [Plutella xylostella]
MDRHPRALHGGSCREPPPPIPPTQAHCAGQGDKPKKPKKKPYEEIGATFNGNEVKIRVPKSTFKPPILSPSQLKLQQECTCDENDSVCDETCGYHTKNEDEPANKLNFLIPDDICEGLTRRTALNSEVVYSRKEVHNPLCQTCNVTPEDAPKGVLAQKLLHPDKDVFVLKIGKQTDEPNRTGNIEVELITPRAPPKLMPAAHACKQIQCEEYEIPCLMPCRPCRAPRRRGRRGYR